MRNTIKRDDENRLTNKIDQEVTKINCELGGGGVLTPSSGSSYEGLTPNSHLSDMSQSW